MQGEDQPHWLLVLEAQPAESSGKNAIFAWKKSKKMRKRIWKTLCRQTVFVGLLLVVCLGTSAQKLIPAPVELKPLGGKTRVRTVDERIDSRLKLPAEGYMLTVSADGRAAIRAKDRRGILWAKATLRQLAAEDGTTPCVRIKDYPAFPLRGFMHDTGRNFRSVEQLKKDLELLSAYKLNLFHWHLTDHPAWRIQCRAYPQLNDARFQRAGRDEGRFYTYDEIRHVIAYARELGITVLPEIDMPGHSQYFEKAFGFSMASKQGMEVLKKCLDEFFGEISRQDCPMIHIGSDEIHIDNPQAFIRFCEEVAHQHGRQVVVWDPGLKASPTAIAQVWRENQMGDVDAIAYPHRYIDSYMGYLNKGNPFCNVVKYLLHTPCGVSSANGKALGGILCLWNDVRVADQRLLFPHNGMPQCLLPFAERFWRGGTALPMGEENLLPPAGSEWHRRITEFERRLSWHRDHLLYDWDMRWVANADLHWRVSLPQPRGTHPDSLRWTEAWGGTVNLIELAKRHHIPLLPTMDAWMETQLFVPRDTVITAWVGFETPPRSSRISDGIGYQGYWESQGRLFVGHQEIFPPEPWAEPGKYRYHEQTWRQAPSEIPYTNEQFFWMRSPARLPLKAGRNTIRLYCPRVFPNESWFVSFIPIHLDANGHVSEAQGIQFY